MPKQLMIHVETDETVVVHNKEKTIKPHIIIDEKELLQFIKSRSQRYYDDEGQWTNVESIKILSVSVESYVDPDKNRL